MHRPPSSPLPIPISFHHRHSRPRPVLLSIIALTTFITLYASRTLLHQTWNLLTLPITWPSTSAGRFLIDEHLDNFDLTFSNYSISQTTAGPGHADLVPPILHHIVLGPQAGHRRHGSHAQDVDAARSHDTEWHAARQACLDLHPDWEAMMWTDANARDFVSEHYPTFLDEWDNYRYPIQRIDALRYLVLFHYGGVILDMDLQCKRALGPLRRFEFVAPAAHPTGFSIGFMMASKGNTFVGEVVKSLSAYNRRWFGFPYPTVMFSTGCHFASTIHARMSNRSPLKILSGGPRNFKLHSLSGRVSTPLFEHLGSSSWHGYDAAFLARIGHASRWRVALCIIGVLCGVLLVAIRPCKQMGALRGKPWYVRHTRHASERRRAMEA